jgi:RimJ/RimL family protein N-acetyltransferase
VRGIVDHTPAVGEAVIETFEIAGRGGEATWTTVELDPPRRWRFSASANAGGQAEIAYTLLPTATGTHFVRELFYRGPNLLFGALNLLRVRAVVERDSATALANVKRDLEAMPAAQ